MIITSSSGIASARKTLLLMNNDDFPDSFSSISFPSNYGLANLYPNTTQTILELAGNGILPFLVTINTVSLIPGPTLTMNNDGKEETIYLPSTGDKYVVIVYDHAGKDQLYASPAIHFNNYLKITATNREPDSGYYRIYYTYYLNP
jgi:hypothetical protein